MVTEQVMPLATFLETEEGQNKCIIAWGIHQVAVSYFFFPWKNVRVCCKAQLLLKDYTVKNKHDILIEVKY